MKKIVVVLLHLGYWLCYLILIMVILGTLFGDDGAVSESKIIRAFHILIYFAIIPSGITFYLFYSVLFNKYLKQRKFILTTLFGAIIALFSAVIGFQLLNWIIISKEGDCFGKENVEVTPLAIILFMAFIASISGIIAFVIKGAITWIDEVQVKEELKLKNQEMELALVKSQLDPHFLFNTINNIDVLILRNANQASDYLNKLSDIMRFMLFETKTDTIPLSSEIAYINKYIELQKIRTSNQSYVSFNVIGEITTQCIAPMIFIPFIENAFKHTNNKKIPDAIQITIETSSNYTCFSCSNKFNQTRQNQQHYHGLGNQLIKRRLQLLYPDKHTLELNNNGQLYQVKLIISHE